MIAEIIVEVSNSEVDKVFDYNLPSSLMRENVVGCRAIVPFGPRKIEGYIINIKETSNLDKSKIKDVVSIIDAEPTILPEMIELSKFMKHKFHLKLVDCLRLFIPAQMRGDKVKAQFQKKLLLKQRIWFWEIKF